MTWFFCQIYKASKLRTIFFNLLFASLLWKEKEKQNYVSWLSFYSVHATLTRSYKGYVCIIHLHILAYKAFSAITLDCKIFFWKTPARWHRFLRKWCRRDLQKYSGNWLRTITYPADIGNYHDKNYADELISTWERCASYKFPSVLSGWLTHRCFAGV